MDPNLARGSVSETFTAGVLAKPPDHESAGSAISAPSAAPAFIRDSFGKRHHLWLAGIAFLIIVFASMAAAATLASNHPGC